MTEKPPGLLDQAAREMLDALTANLLHEFRYLIEPADQSMQKQHNRDDRNPV